MLSVWAASPAISTALCDAWLCDAWWFEAFDGCLRGVAFERFRDLVLQIGSHKTLRWQCEFIKRF